MPFGDPIPQPQWPTYYDPHYWRQCVPDKPWKIIPGSYKFRPWYVSD